METESMEERLGKLEEKLARAERRYRLVLAGVGVVFLACAVIWVVIGTAGRAQAQKLAEVSKVIRANSFALLDGQGQCRAMLTMTEGMPSLSLHDGNGTPRAALIIYKDGPGLVLYDEKGDFRARLSVPKYGPELSLSGEKGHAWVKVNEYGPGLGTGDENGSVTWSAP